MATCAAMVRTPAGGRRAKIICTIGPATDRPGVLERLIESGMDGARLNLSFGEHAEHIRRIAELRELTARLRRRPVAIIADIPGRKVRLGHLAGRKVTLEPGGRVRLSASAGPPGDNTHLPVDREIIHDNMMRGDRILLSDGLVELVITGVHPPEVHAEVIFGGEVSERTGVHVPGMLLRGGPLEERDLPHLQLAIQQAVDYVALTYVADASDILAVRERMVDLGRDIPIIAKIERSEAFTRLDGILNRSDAVMIRRGDLGAEIEVTRIPLVQKEILRLANNRGVPVIIATQMLGSMISSPTPTRAEASDVSNAVADGADGVLLSAETATGSYPVEAVSMMGRIIRETESSLTTAPRTFLSDTPLGFADATAAIACQAAVQCDAKLIVCFTESGRTATLLAKYRPAAPLLAFCTKDETRRKLAIGWGIRTDELGPSRDVEQMVVQVERRLLDRGLIRGGDRLVIAFGAPVGHEGNTNSVRLHEVVEGPGRVARA